MSHVYKVEYRHNYDEKWKHYYCSEIKGDALDMQAHHISNYSHEQCQITYVETMHLYEYIPVNQEDDDEV